MVTGPRRWPLLVIAAPAAVAVWSGWVGLGELAGFGIVHPLPGIIGGLRLNTAITLPVGVEAYGAYALGAWLRPDVPERARGFARRSAIGALVLGMLGQVVYHLLAAAHAARAPWPVVVLVSCLPVVTLGFGAALTHLLRADPGNDDIALSDTQVIPEAAPAVPPEVTSGSPAPALEAAPGATPGTPLHSVPGGTRKRSPATPGKQPGPATPERVREYYGGELAAGRVPSIRQIKREWPVGYDRAAELHDALKAAREAAS